MKKFVIFFIILLTFLIYSNGENIKYYPEKDSIVAKKIEEWRGLKFGLLMHWGPYSQWGIVESWSICAEDEPWCKRKIDNYEEYKRMYENLKYYFNPVRFNPEKWAKAAKDAGMKYVIFTTKHHDGFCMFDTKYTDYKITSKDCPFSVNPKANITKEIFNAFRKEGLWVGAYFSKPDWHCDYYWWRNFATPDRNVNYDIKKYPERWEKFIEYTHNQITELMSNYGKVDILWLDGGWVNAGNKNQDIKLGELVKQIRKLQPGLIVVDRAVPGLYQNYLTPENTIPKDPIKYPWESCIIAGGGWSWVPNAKYKTTEEVIAILAEIVAKGGNLLLNIAPGPDGDWDSDAYNLLQNIGNWMKINSEAIYNTKPYKFYKYENFFFTQKENCLYAIHPAKNKKFSSNIKISSKIINKFRQIYLLGYQQPLIWKKNKKNIIIELPANILKHEPFTYGYVLKFLK